MPTNHVRFWQESQAIRGGQTGVSLHSHTLHSQEGLGFIPYYCSRLPFLSWALRAQEQVSYRKHHREPLDFQRAWWTPPLAPREAYRVEREQIEQSLQRQAFVSITDHDTIDACLHLEAAGTAVPISVEWTVPFGPSFFHLGIHNLPPAEASLWMADLAAFTASPDRARLHELLAALQELPETLVVLNHPLWDEKPLGNHRYLPLLREFLDDYQPYLHAFELNGLRRWEENLGVIRLAEERGAVLVSGGDRHGLEPNACVNLTDADTFAEFVAEIRHGRRSHVVFMPQYREPYRLRVLRGLMEVMREDAQQCPGRARWSDRVYYRGNDGVAKPLSAWWAREPLLVRQFLWVVRLMESRAGRAILRKMMAQDVASQEPEISLVERAAPEVPSLPV